MGSGLLIPAEKTHLVSCGCSDYSGVIDVKYWDCLSLSKFERRFFVTKTASTKICSFFDLCY